MAVAGAFGQQRATAIRYMEPAKFQLLLQVSELGNGLSAALDTRTGGMSAGLVKRDDVFILFGAWTRS